MSWWRRSLISKELAAQLHERRPGAGDVLAVGHGGRVRVLATEECLVLLHEHAQTGEGPTASEDAEAGDDGWEFIGWHTISRGGWKADRSELRWTFVDMSEGRVQLDDPGRVPEVFRDRVNSSVAVEKVSEAPGGGHVVVAGRRQLGPHASPGVVWQVTTLGKARLSDPATAQLATAEARALQQDFE